MVGMLKQISVGHGLFATVDDRDYKMLIKHTWCVRKSKNSAYAYTNINTRRRLRNGKFKYYGMPMHRLILGAPKSAFVDHIDGNGLNNVRRNIRICSRAQNAKNRKRQKSSRALYKGISFCKTTQKWRPRLHVEGRNISFGLFACALEAAKAYDAMAVIHHGEFARLNFPK